MTDAEGDKISYAAILTAIVSVSFASIFIRLAEAPPASVAALRMLFSSLLILPFAAFSPVFRAEVRGMRWRDIGLLCIAGLMLSLHFIFWITSLSLTGVTSSIVFVTTSPLFVALYSVIVFREKVSRSFWVGLILVTLGAAVMGGWKIAAGGDAWRGDLLAVAGGAAAAGYFLAGSRMRRKYSLITYISGVYTAATLMLLVALPVTGSSIAGLSGKAYLYCFLMAVICQLTGHSIFNWALKRMQATVVAIATLGEPIGTSLLALIILGESPVKAELAGGALILAGLFTALYFKPAIAKRAADGIKGPQGSR